MTPMRILVLSNRNIYSKLHLYGEDYYIRSLVEIMKQRGYNVTVAVLSDNTTIQVYKDPNNTFVVNNINDILSHYNVVILHNISPSKILLERVKHKFKVVMPVYFLWNLESSAIANVRSRIGLTLWQFIIDEYIATSLEIVKGLRRQAVLKRIHLIPPTYRCRFCKLEDNLKKMKELKKKGLPRNVKVVYIGSLSLRRLPLIEAVKFFNRDHERFYEITIYTSTPTREKVFKIGNTKIRIIRKILSDEEKCKVLRESHVFIAPRSKTAMQPPISILEAVHHGNIVLRL